MAKEKKKDTFSIKLCDWYLS